MDFPENFLDQPLGSYEFGLVPRTSLENAGSEFDLSNLEEYIFDDFLVNHGGNIERTLPTVQTTLDLQENLDLQPIIPKLEPTVTPKSTLKLEPTLKLEAPEPDVALMNRVLDSPHYIYHNSNPLNPVSNSSPFMEHDTHRESQKVDPSQPSQMFDFEMKSEHDDSLLDMTGMVDVDESNGIMGSFPPSDGIPTPKKMTPAKQEEKDFKTPKNRKKPVASGKKKPANKKRRVYETIVAKPGGLESRQSSAQLKLEEKKRKHRIIERTRRNKLNEGFKNLGQIVQKINRADILSAAIDKLQEFESKQRGAQAEIERLKQVVIDSEKKAQSLAKSQTDKIDSSFKFPLYVARSDVDYREVFLNSGVAMAISRIDGNFIDCNIAFEELTGYTRGELLTTNMFALTHSEDLPKMFACVRGMLTNRYSICKAVKKWVQKNGDLFQCSCMVSVVNDRETGKVKYFVCIGPPKNCTVDELYLQQTIMQAMVRKSPVEIGLADVK